MAKLKKIVKKTEKPTKSRKPILRYLFLAILIGGIGYLSFASIKDTISHRLAGIYEIEKGILEQELFIDQAWLFRDETPVYATASGVLLQSAPEGKRVAENDLLVRIQTHHGEVKEIKATRAGVVCYHLDGLEGAIGPENISSLDLTDRNFGNYKLEEMTQGTQVVKGQPLLKIINNLKPAYLNVKFDSKDLAVFPAEGQKIPLRFEGKQCVGVVREIQSQGIDVFALIELDRGEFHHERELALSLLLQAQEGLILPNTALIDTDEGVFVYKLLTKGRRLVPVEIIMQNQEYASVIGLERGDRIISKPYKLNNLSEINIKE